MKEVFPADVTARFKKDFAYVGADQSRADLDVYLLHKAPYTALLPAPCALTLSRYLYTCSGREQSVSHVSTPFRLENLCRHLGPLGSLPGATPCGGRRGCQGVSTHH